MSSTSETVKDLHPVQVGHVAYLQAWTETERGWGQRPDGHTLYASLEAREAHIEKYMADLRARHGSSAPDDAAGRISRSEGGYIWLWTKEDFDRAVITS